MKLTIARCDNGVKDINLKYWDITPDSLVNEFKTPKIGKKDGSYFIRCKGTTRNNKDTDDTANILILDGDSRITADGEIKAGSPDPKLVSEVLTRLFVGHIIYSSHSNAMTQSEIDVKRIESEFDSGGLSGKDFHKYRVIIPCIYTPDQLPVLLDYLFKELHQAGVMLSDVSENRSWSQPWYFPRVPDQSRLESYAFYSYLDAMLDVESIYKQWQQEQPINKEPSAVLLKNPIDESNGRLNPIKEFNQSYTVGEILSHRGYIKKGDRYLRPASTSKIPAVQICKDCNDGVERVYSWGNDVLNDGYSHDAFDCMRLLDHNGDWKLALNWNPDLTKHNQKIHAKEAALKTQTTPAIIIDPLINSQEQAGQNENCPVIVPPKKTVPLFKFAEVSELMDRKYNPDFMIKTLFECNALGQIFGATGSGKSFVVLDMAYCIATGRDYHGLPTKQGNVAYICGEGFRAIGRRVNALQMHYGADVKDKLFISEQAGAFMDIGVTESVAEAIKSIGNVSLVIIDTYHRNMGGGNENSADDFAQILRNIDIFLKPLNVTVLVVHHSGHMDTDRSRGSSSIRAAMDFEYQVTKNHNTVTLKPTKIKDGTTPQNMHFELIDSEIGKDDEGNPITSAYLETKADGENYTGKKRGLSVNDSAVLTSLSDAITKHGVSPSKEITDKFAGFTTFNGEIMQKVVLVDHWREFAYKAITTNSDTEEQKKSAKRKAFARSQSALIKANKIHTYDDYVWFHFTPDLPL